MKGKQTFHVRVSKAGRTFRLSWDEFEKFAVKHQEHEYELHLDTKIIQLATAR